MIKMQFPQWTIKLIRSYLENRQVAFRIDKSISNVIRTKTRVPRSSVLGLLLLNLYITDPPITKYAKIGHFTDDIEI